MDVELGNDVLCTTVGVVKNGVVDTHVRFGTEIVRLLLNVMLTLIFVKLIQRDVIGSIRPAYNI